MTTVRRKSSPSGDLGCVPISPQLGNDDSLMLKFLTSVRIWSVSFYESVQSNDEASASIRQSWPEQSQEINFTFKLVIDMLNRGHGSLAGRVVRKAFLLVEEILMLEGPALLWNMLEMFHFMVMLSHFQLFQLLLAHLMALVDGRMPKYHPLPGILRTLRVFAASLPNQMSASSDSLLTPSPSPSLPDGNETATTAGSWLFSGALSSMIERAWTLNAEILFDHFDHRLFQLYSRIHWDSCSIEPPTAIIGAAKQWLTQVTSQQSSSSSARANQTEGFFQITPLGEDRMLQRLFATPLNISPPRNYELLRMSSITALQDHANSILSKGGGFAGDTTRLLRILAGLTTAKVLEGRPVITDLSNAGIDVASKISRVHAGNVACAVRTSMDLNAEYDGLEAPVDTLEQVRSIVVLQEYATTETDPRVIRDMWLLEDALIAAGEHQEASEVRRTAYRRLEQYIQDVPLNSA